MTSKLAGCKGDQFSFQVQKWDHTYLDFTALQKLGGLAPELDQMGAIGRVLLPGSECSQGLTIRWVYLDDRVQRDNLSSRNHRGKCQSERRVGPAVRVVGELNLWQSVDFTELGRQGFCGNVAIDNVSCTEGLEVFRVVQGRGRDYERESGQSCELNS